MQTDTCTDSKEGIPSCLGDITAVDELNQGLLKIIKVEDSEDDINPGKTVVHVQYGSDWFCDWTLFTTVTFPVFFLLV